MQPVSKIVLLFLNFLSDENEGQLVVSQVWRELSPWLVKSCKAPVALRQGDFVTSLEAASRVELLELERN